MPGRNGSILSSGQPTAGWQESGLTTRATNPADAAAVVRCAEEVFGAAWTSGFIAWKYFQNPAGRIYGRCAELDGQPVGFYGHIPLRVMLRGEILPAAQAVDAMVAPGARRRGVFVRLARETFAEMDRAGVRLAYVFPSPAAQAAFTDRLGWTPAGAVPRYVQILASPGLTGAADSVLAKGKAAALWGAARVASALMRTAAQAEELMRPGRHANLRITTAQACDQSFDARFDALWAAAAPAAIAVVRDAAYLNWRYAQQPLRGYTTITAERDGRLAGYVVLSSRDIAQHGTLALVEWLVMPGEEATAHALLAASRSHALALGCSQLHCWMLPQHAFYVRALQRAGFVYWPWRCLPGALRHTTPFIIRRQPGAALQPDPAQIANWYLTMGDHDYY